MADELTPSGERILMRVRFDPRLPTYFMLNAVFVMAITFFGILLIPIWLLGIGQYVHRRQYESMEAELTLRTLNIRRGVLFRTQKSVPLDKITDLAVSEGPILRRLGLCSLRVETAGGGGGSQMGQAHLPGVVDALEFRDAVMRQRDLVTGSREDGPEREGAEEGTLTEIRDALLRIEALLGRRA